MTNEDKFLEAGWRNSKTNPLAGFLADLDTEEKQEEASIEKLLRPYHDNADASTAYGKTAAKDGKRIKEWLALNPGIDLYDDTGLRAYLQTKRVAGHKFDLVAIIENNPALFDRLVSTRSLLVDYDKAVASDLGGELKRYEIPMGETSALQVVPNK